MPAFPCVRYIDRAFPAWVEEEHVQGALTAGHITSTFTPTQELHIFDVFDTHPQTCRDVQERTMTTLACHTRGARCA